LVGWLVGASHFYVVRTIIANEAAATDS